MIHPIHANSIGGLAAARALRWRPTNYTHTPTNTGGGAQCTPIGHKSGEISPVAARRSSIIHDAASQKLNDARFTAAPRSPPNNKLERCGCF